jgi:phosphoserine phosphatase
MLDRTDESPPLEERTLVPEQAVELGRVVAPKAAPQDEQVARRQSGRRVELEARHARDRVADAGGAPVEELRANCDPAKLLRRTATRGLTRHTEAGSSVTLCSSSSV